MDNEYYGVASTPMDDFLAHYGVRGMKWGVRKALQNGNSKSLDRQYKKAAKKLAKLNERTDIAKQQNIATKSNKNAKRALGIGIAGIGAATGNKLLSGHLLKKAADSATQVNLWKASKKRAIDKLTSDRDNVIKSNWELLKDPKNYSGISKEEAIRRTDSFNKNIVEKYYNKDIARESDYYDAQINAHQDNHNRSAAGSKISDSAHKIVGGIGVAALGVAAGNKIKSTIAKKRATEKGHAKAVAERDAWKNEMKSAFKGTKYAGQYSVPIKKRRKNNG